MDSQAKQRHKQINCSNTAREAKQHWSAHRLLLPRLIKSAIVLSSQIFFSLLYSPHFISLPFLKHKWLTQRLPAHYQFSCCFWDSKKERIYCRSHKYCLCQSSATAGFISIVGEGHKQLADTLIAYLSLIHLLLKAHTNFSCCVIVMMYN